MQPEQLGPYRIVKQLGKGGMGTVYEGQRAESGGRVAIKVLNPQLAAADGFRDRFEAEIESLKKLRHPAIVRLYGYGEQEGCLYYSMELVEGPTLDRQLRRGRQFDWHEVTRIGIQVAKALKHAHDHGVIHRDIKPANLLVDPLGQVKLSDFGIARVFGRSQLTAAGGIIGTAEYMAPEQASGMPLDPRCDQYSLGCVLYALLAGRPPFRASGLPELLQLQRFAEPEPIRSFAPAVPEELERIIGQLLSKDPAHRFRNAMVLARRLEAMEKALTRQTSSAPDSAAGDDRKQQRADWDGLAETLRTDVGQGEEEEEGASEGGMGGEGEGRSGLPDDGETALSVDPMPPATPATPAETENRFTTIEEAERRERLRQAEPTLQSLVQGLVLLVALLLLALVVWYAMRPPSASDLVEEITAAADDEQVDSLLRARTAIDQFMRRFPHDPRAAQIADYQRQVRFFQLERRLQNRARRGEPQDELTPGEQLYVAAFRRARTDRAAALAQFEALVDLFQVEASVAEAFDVDPAGAGRLVTLAQRQVERLRHQVDREAKSHRAVLETRLRAADRLRDTDLAAARRIWRGLVQLYGDRPWARDLVARARSALAATDSLPSATGIGPASTPPNAAAAPAGPANQAHE